MHVQPNATTKRAPAIDAAALSLREDIDEMQTGRYGVLAFINSGDVYTILKCDFNEYKQKVDCSIITSSAAKLKAAAIGHYFECYSHRFIFCDVVSDEYASFYEWMDKRKRVDKEYHMNMSSLFSMKSVEEWKKEFKAIKTDKAIYRSKGE